MLYNLYYDFVSSGTNIIKKSNLKKLLLFYEKKTVNKYIKKKSNLKNCSLSSL